MIFYAPTEAQAAPSISVVASEQRAKSKTYQAAAVGSGSTGNLMALAVEGVRAEIQPASQQAIESFNWRDATTLRRYIQLEQKVLAGKADSGEIASYHRQRAHRNSQVFADRYLHDYLEVQRLKKLSEKLAEVERYLRPIPLP
jgi:hypothetical protein